MTVITEVAVSAGATIGSVVRYGIGQWITKISSSEFPWGTWLINATGAFLLGLLRPMLGNIDGDLNGWMLGISGFCGGFTTFSTMSVETVRLLRASKLMAAVYVVSSVGVGCTLAWIASVLM